MNVEFGLAALAQGQKVVSPAGQRDTMAAQHASAGDPARGEWAELMQAAVAELETASGATPPEAIEAAWRLVIHLSAMGFQPALSNRRASRSAL